MERDFWLERWDSDRIGFHQPDTHALLAEHWPALGLPAGPGVFVPLCGKSLDMRYLGAARHAVIGVEHSRVAIESYFAEGGQSFEREDLARLVRYRGSKTTLYCGDFFDLRPADLDGVRGVYDRAALIAIPVEKRQQYANHLLRIVPDHTSMLLITLEYDQDRVEGPPFSVPRDEVERLFASQGRIERLEARPADGLPPRYHEAGVIATEVAYHIGEDHTR